MIACASFLKLPYSVKLLLLALMTSIYLVIIEFLFEDLFNPRSYSLIPTAGTSAYFSSSSQETSPDLHFTTSSRKLNVMLPAADSSKLNVRYCKKIYNSVRSP